MAGEQQATLRHSAPSAKPQSACGLVRRASRNRQQSASAGDKLRPLATPVAGYGENSSGTSRRPGSSGKPEMFRQRLKQRAARQHLRVDHRYAQRGSGNRAPEHQHGPEAETKRGISKAPGEASYLENIRNALLEKHDATRESCITQCRSATPAGGGGGGGCGTK